MASPRRRSTTSTRSSRSSRSRRRPISPRCPRRPNNYHPSVSTKEATAAAQWIIEPDGRERLRHARAGDAAKAKPLTVNIRPFGAQIAAADYFAEEVRRAHARDASSIGEEKLYRGGLSVRTTLNPAAAEDGAESADRRPRALRPVTGLARRARPDRRRRRLGRALGRLDCPTDIEPWRYGVVLQVTTAKARVGLKPRGPPDGSCDRRADGRDPVRRDQVGQDSPRGRRSAYRRAQGRRRDPRRARSDKRNGRVVADADPRGPRRHGRHGPAHRPRPRHRRRLLVLESQFDRATQAKRQPGSSFKPFVYAAALDNGYKPTSVVLDAPITIEQERPGRLEAEELHRCSLGPSTLRTGIEKSRNLMTVRLAQDMGMPLVVEYARTASASTTTCCRCCPCRSAPAKPRC